MVKVFNHNGSGYVIIIFSHFFSCLFFSFFFFTFFLLHFGLLSLFPVNQTVNFEY